MDVERAEKNVPVFYFVFDILYYDNVSLISVPLRDRRQILQSVICTHPQVQTLQQFESDAELAYETCVSHGFEGIVAKRLDSHYESGRRSPSWLKIKAQQTDEFVIGGFTAGQGSRGTSFGALLLGQYNAAGDFMYCGSVGTGFDERLLNITMRKMLPLHIPKCPFKKRPDEKKQVVWIQPEIVIEAKSWIGHEIDIFARRCSCDFVRIRHQVKCALQVSVNVMPEIRSISELASLQTASVKEKETVYEQQTPKTKSTVSLLSTIH